MYWRNNGSIVNVNIIQRVSNKLTVKLHAVVVLELLLSEQCPLLQMCVCVCVCLCVCPLLQVCEHLDGSNAENKISLLVILYNYVCKKKKKKSKPIFVFTKPIMVKCLNIGRNIGQPIYRSISTWLALWLSLLSTCNWCVVRAYTWLALCPSLLSTCSRCVASTLVLLSCGSRRIIQVDAAHWWWLRRDPPPPPTWL